MHFFIKNAILCAILGTLSLAISSHAYIHQIDIWHKLDSKGKITQKLYCMSDIHGLDLAPSPEEKLSHIKAEQEQRAALLDQCKKLEGNSTLFIVEDAASVTDIKHPKIQSLMSLNKKAWRDRPLAPGNQPLLLHYLADLLREEKQNVANAETRQVRSGAYSVYNAALIYKANDTVFQKIISLFAPTNQEIAEEFKNSMALARTFCTTDGPTLAKYYTGALAQLAATMSFTDKLAKTAGYYHDFIKYCSELPISIPAQFVHGNLLKWGADILDINALHHIYQASGYRKICVIMGGSHIFNISTVLPNLGYTKVKTLESFETRPFSQEDLKSFVHQTARANRAGLQFMNENGISETELLQELNVEKLNALTQKIAHAKPISNSDFNVLTEKKSKRPKKKSLFGFLRNKTIKK